MHSKRKVFETGVKSVANVCLFDVCSDEKNGRMELCMTGNNV